MKKNNNDNFEEITIANNLQISGYNYFEKIELKF